MRRTFLRTAVVTAAVAGAAFAVTAPAQAAPQDRWNHGNANVVIIGGYGNAFGVNCGSAAADDSIAVTNCGPGFFAFDD